MMISSGNSGMTSSTSVSRLSELSHSPPRKAAATPISTAIPVAASPTTNAMIITSRVPQTSWAHMSWPCAVVPSRWAVDSPSFGW